MIIRRLHRRLAASLADVTPLGSLGLVIAVLDALSPRLGHLAIACLALMAAHPPSGQRRSGGNLERRAVLRRSDEMNLGWATG